MSKVAQARLTRINTFKREQRTCKYVNCPHPEITCDAGRERHFQLNHIDPASKVGDISSMFTNYVAFDDKQFDRELSDTVVELMHAQCHLMHTKQQRAERTR